MQSRSANAYTSPPCCVTQSEQARKSLPGEVSRGLQAALAIHNQKELSKAVPQSADPLEWTRGAVRKVYQYAQKSATAHAPYTDFLAKLTRETEGQIVDDHIQAVLRSAASKPNLSLLYQMAEVS